MNCKKCGYSSNELKIKFNIHLCELCFLFSPNKKENFLKYVDENVDGSFLDTFRKQISKEKKHKTGMIEKAKKGKVMSRSPFGYSIKEGVLFPSEKSREVVDIFEEFVKDKITLSEIAKKHNLSINGLKKILRNFTYIGKIKFNNQIYEGNHEKLISPVLFNKVQDKLENLGIK